MQDSFLRRIYTKPPHQRDNLIYPNSAALPVPQGPLLLIILELGRLNGLREGKEGQGEVGEAVLELLDGVVPLDQLVELEGDEPGHEGGGGGDGGDDAACDTLRGQPVGGGDGVVLCTQVARGCKKNIFMLIIIPFFKLYF
jgi:hypothetical protein